MMYEEFCNYVKDIDPKAEEPDFHDYTEFIEKAYVYHPMFDVDHIAKEFKGNTKKAVADMYVKYGTPIFKDMLLIAKKFEEVDRMLEKKRAEKRRIEQEYQDILDQLETMKKGYYGYKS